MLYGITDLCNMQTFQKLFYSHFYDFSFLFSENLSKGILMQFNYKTKQKTIEISVLGIIAVFFKHAEPHCFNL